MQLQKWEIYSFIMDDSAIICDEIIESNNEETKSV